MLAQTITLAPTSAATSPPKPAIAARTKLLLEGPILSTLLRLSAPNILNLLAIAGMITFDGLFMGRLGSDVDLSRRDAALAALRRHPQGRRAWVDQCDHHQSLGGPAHRYCGSAGQGNGNRLRARSST